MPKRKKDDASLRKPREKNRKNYLPTDIDPVPESDLRGRTGGSGAAGTSGSE